MERKKSLGQCFLEDRNILALEAKLAQPQGRTVLEIGPGDGRLTEAVLALGPKKMIAVEKDSRFASLLREKFAGKAEIIEGDFLKVEPPACDIVIGNIPYYISSDIVFSIAPLKLERAVLMVQKEFAQKMVAEPGEKNYGRLSVTAQTAFEVKLERIVPRHLFRPIPKVDSAIIVLTPTGIKLDRYQEDVIRSLFSHRNKLVRGALMDSGFEPAELEGLGAFKERRVRTLTKEECMEIARILKNL